MPKESPSMKVHPFRRAAATAALPLLALLPDRKSVV